MLQEKRNGLFALWQVLLLLGKEMRLFMIKLPFEGDGGPFGVINYPKYHPLGIFKVDVAPPIPQFQENLENPVIALQEEIFQYYFLAIVNFQALHHKQKDEQSQGNYKYYES
jgi:hypothetical protein